jgi:hypothetical protein
VSSPSDASILSITKRLNPVLDLAMNFYPAPPVIEAKLYVRIPDEKRCIGKETEWRGGFARQFQDIFLEGPVADNLGNLYVVDIPFGRVLKIDSDKNVTVAAEWDGEPNGLAATADGDFLVADYKQVRTIHSEVGAVHDLTDCTCRASFSSIPAMVLFDQSWHAVISNDSKARTI